MVKKYLTQPLLLSAIISGICVGTSYIPFPPWAILFSFAPLMHFWLKESSWKKVFLAGWICQFLFTLIGFNWVAHTVSEFGRMPAPVALLALVGFCSFANLNIPLAGLVWHKLFSKSSSLTLKCLSLVTTLAISERVYPMIFDWHMGYTWLWAKFPGFHLADIFGFLGLSTITWFLQGLVLYFWNREQGARRFAGISAALIIFGILNGLGFLHAPKFDQVEIKKIAVIQANIGNLEKQMAHKGMGFRQSILDRYIDLSRAESPYQPDFYIWPETAFPDVLTEKRLSGFYGAQLMAFLEDQSANLITGSYSEIEVGPKRQRQTTNSLLFLGPSGFLAEGYHKTYLLAFGEYLPLGTVFPQLRKLVPQVADFARGSGPSVRYIGSFGIGGQICYEGLFDHFSRSLALDGAHLIVNVTNDSWFGRWQEPWQHLYMTLARAIEIRRPLIRSTNTGISTAITAAGDIHIQSPVHQEWSHTFHIPVPLNPPNTVFMGFGYWVFPSLLLILFVGSLIFVRRKV